MNKTLRNTVATLLLAALWAWTLPAFAQEKIPQPKLNTPISVPSDSPPSALLSELVVADARQSISRRSGNGVDLSVLRATAGTYATAPYRPGMGTNLIGIALYGYYQAPSMQSTLEASMQLNALIAAQNARIIELLEQIANKK